MSYNGSGTFNINTTGQPVVAGTVISSSAFNALTTDLATGLTTAITKDGQTTTTARITFAQGITSSLVTDSSSTSTGSIITDGGVGIAKNLYVGGTLNVMGSTSLTNPVINNIKMGYSTTATAGGSTSLTVSSNYRQFFTGTLAQTIVLPVTSTLVTGMAYEIENNSTGLLTVNSSGGNLVGTIPAGVCAHAVCIGTTLTTAADWDWDYISTSTITGTGANVLGTSPTITTATLASPNITTALTLTGSAGTSGQALVSAGSGNAPTWSTVSSDTVGFKNRLFNGSMVVDQRNAGSSQTFTAGAALAYSVDRWYGYCTGANVTGQQVSGTYASSLSRYQFTGAASVTAIGFGQRIEQKNSFDLANTTVTLSCYISNSLLTTVTWTAYYANTADAFGTLASPTRTQISTGTFTVTSTRTQYSTNISIPSAATTGIEIVFTVGAQTSGTWIIDSVQLEKGSTATSFDYRPYTTELQLCQRYYYQTWGSGSFSNNGPGYVGQVLPASNNSSSYGSSSFPTSMRAAPTITTYDSTGSSGNVSQPGTANGLAATAGNISISGFYNVTKSSSTFTVLVPVSCQYIASIEL
jgi:hypothetical protein